MQIAVTGATGFIGSEVVKVLLARGHTVRGTVRNPDDAAKVAPLKELEGRANGFSSSKPICLIVRDSTLPSKSATW